MKINNTLKRITVIAVFFILLGAIFLVANKRIGQQGARLIEPGTDIAWPGRGLFGQPCEGKEVGRLNIFPLAPENIELLVPMGRVQDSHVIPTDHQYVIPKGTKDTSIITDSPRLYEIKAPADGYIINIELFREPVEKAYRGGDYADNYLVLFEHSCNWYTRLIHIDTLSEKVLGSFAFDNPSDPHPFASTRIKVKEGEVIGTVGPHSFDFQIMDFTNQDKGIISPDNIDFFSSYTVDTFDYINDTLKNELLPKNIRTRPPLGGRIAYDIPSKLIGNWFRIGRDKNNREEYWTENLSIVYDHIDESQIRVSFGNYNGYPKAYAVRGNTPDPASIDKNFGLVKYELSQFDYFDENGSRWDAVHFAKNLSAKNTEERRGVVLFELEDDRTLKVEVFPRLNSADQVNGFTSKAVMYER
ncbi:MAG: hypothetical protein HYY51_04410 [Candidatus Magasanikbacteria bacterium]|nr:hypothetical protein [Candidatus Magasanikbacteria bacterium]